MYIYLLIIFFSAVTVFADSNLQIKPDKVKEFDKIDFIYTPDERLRSADVIKVFVYCFNNTDNKPNAYDVELTPKDERYVGSFQLPDHTVFGLVKIFGQEVEENYIDDNRGELWHFLVQDINSKVIENSYLKAALSFMGNQPENYMRNVDLQQAVNLLEKEIQNYPKNISAQIGYQTLMFDLKKLNYDEYIKNLKTIITNDLEPNNENDIKAISRVYRILNQKSQAEKIEKEFAKKNPEGTLAEEAVLSALSKAESFQEFTSLALEYFKLYPISSNRERILSAFSTSFLQMGKTKQLIERLDKIKNVSIITYLQVANEIIENDKILSEFSESDRLITAREIYSIAMSRLKSEKEAPYVFKPKELTRTEWDNELRMIESIAYKTGGDLELKNGNIDEAITLYEGARRIASKDTDPEIYEKLAELYVKQNKYDRVFLVTDEAIRYNKATEKVEALFVQGFTRAKGIPYSDAMKSLDMALKYAEENRIKMLKYSALDKDVVSGMFTRLNDTYEDIYDYRGQVLVLMMWSTWCGPCQVMFPAYEKLYLDFVEDDNVEIASVNIWEQDQDRAGIVREFLKETKANFPIFIDETDIFPRKIGIIGLPTIIVLDKNGKLQFQQTGFTNEDDFLMKINDKIEFLLNREEYD